MGEKEFDFKGLKMNGFLILFINLVLMFLCLALLFTYNSFGVPGIVFGVVGIIVSLFLLGDFMQLEPNQARAMAFFGKYKGTFKLYGKMALTKLSEENIIELDKDKKAAMVSNLLVVLCADEAAQPVVNTGTLNQ